MRERVWISLPEFNGGVGSAFGGIGCGASLGYAEDDSPCGENGGVCAKAVDLPTGLASILGVEWAE